MIAFSPPGNLPVGGWWIGIFGGRGEGIRADQVAERGENLFRWSSDEALLVRVTLGNLVGEAKEFEPTGSGA